MLRQRVQAAAELGYETIMLNYNPETVSTDYDVCDKLVFDEISSRRSSISTSASSPYGVVVSMGGQMPNNLAMRLAPGRRADPRDAAPRASTRPRTAASSARCSTSSASTSRGGRT